MLFWYAFVCVWDEKAGSARLGGDEALRRGREHFIFLELCEQKYVVICDRVPDPQPV